MRSLRYIGVMAALLGFGCSSATPASSHAQPGAVEAPAAPEIAAACARLITCQEAEGLPANGVEMSVGACVWNAVSTGGAKTKLLQDGRSQVTIDCVNAGNDCTDVRTCLFGSSLKTRCPPSVRGVDECDALIPDTTCVSASILARACAIRTCQASDAPMCQNDLYTACQLGFLVPTDCKAKGETCGTDSSGSPACVGAGAPCDDSSAPHCDGDDRVSCVGGHEARQSCNNGAIPATCTGGSECMPKADLECDPTKTPDSCDGNSIIYCDGHYQRLDCRSIGFQRCIPWSSGVICE